MLFSYSPTIPIIFSKKGGAMNSQESQNAYSASAIFKIIRRLSRRIKLLYHRNVQWRQMKRNHEALLRMEDRMLKDIGLSRFDVRRMGRDQNYWRHMFQPEESKKEIEPIRKEASIGKRDPVKCHPSSDFCLCSSDRSFSRN